MLLEAGRLASLESAVTEFEENLTHAAAYLTRRGLTKEVAETFRLGVVSSDTSEDWRPYRGRLAIPYLSHTRPIAIKFRCIRDHDCKESGCPKYMCEEGVPVPLFNPRDLLRDEPRLYVTEGELDAVVVSGVLGLPCVGYAGTAAWQSYFNKAIGPDWESIIVIADGDDPGRKAARETARHVKGKVLKLPDGEDASSLLLREGAEVLRERLESR
jgi:DNA primase